MASHIGLTSDKNLAVDEPSLEWIRKYADDQALFFRDFSGGVREDVRDWRDVRVRDGRWSVGATGRRSGASERSRWDDTKRRGPSVDAAAFLLF